MIIEKKGDEITYNASSQDELALVNFAKFANYEYSGMDSENNMILKINDDFQKFKLLHIFEFNSTRKRMSIIFQAENEIILYCKGADTIIHDRLQKNNPIINETWKILDKYAETGLRTLVLAKKILNLQNFEIWNEKYREASSSINDREALMESLQNQLERDLDLVAVTAIEDKLQDNVGSTISVLRDAGIQIWILTGDKIETAINVALSCNLINSQMRQIILDGKNEDIIVESITKAMEGVIFIL